MKSIKVKIKSSYDPKRVEYLTKRAIEKSLKYNEKYYECDDEDCTIPFFKSNMEDRCVEGKYYCDECFLFYSNIKIFEVNTCLDL